MKRIVALGFLTILTISCSQKVLTKPSGLNPDRAIALLPAYSLPKQDIFYLSRQFGFRFVQPSGYLILNATKSSSPKPNTPVQVLEIWKQEDYANRIHLTESPAIISISIYSNPLHLPLENWKDKLSRNDTRPFTVAGQQALAYSATGLYESDNVLFSSPDGRYVFHLKGDYLSTSDSIRQTFQDILSSFSHDIMLSLRHDVKS